MKRFIWLTLIFLLLALPQVASADAAPPQPPPGANPGPGGEFTQVRMVAETVLITVLEGAPVRAQVTADFTMRNLGTESESMAARFPISHNDGYYNYPELENFQVAVDGRTVPSRRMESPAYPEGDEMVPWAEFDVTFPPGQDVELHISYTLDAADTGLDPTYSFYYILETGAGWNGTIGSGELILRLPYAASAQNVWTTDPKGTISGNEVRWHFEDLEPTGQDNLTIDLLSPRLWRDLLTERGNVVAHPNDGEAWGRLGKASKAAIAYDRYYGISTGGGADELYALSVEAYERALELLPRDALWHAGFAELLAMHALGAPVRDIDRAEVLRAMQEMQSALDLAAENDVVMQMAGDMMEWMEYAFPDAMLEADGTYTFLWLTATPTEPPTQTPVPAPTGIGAISIPDPTHTYPWATATLTMRVATETPTPGREAAAGLQLPCGSAAMLFFPLAVLLVSRRRCGVGGRAARF